jgi:dTMP kinase
MYENKTLNYKNVYIVAEGGEGGGKSLQLDKLGDYLKGKNIKSHFTFEPGGGIAAKAIRESLLHGEYELDPYAQFMLFCASRRETINTEVEPYLEKDYDVFSDRSFVCSMAYQGFAFDYGIEKVFEESLKAIKGFVPDRIWYFDIDPKIGLERAKKVSEEKGLKNDRYEDQKLDFHYKVNEGYIKTGEILNSFFEHKPFKVIDANRGIEEIFEDVKKDYESASLLKRLDDGNMVRACEFLKQQKFDLGYK